MIWLDPSADVEVEGSTLAIRTPMQSQRRRGRKRIVTTAARPYRPRSRSRTRWSKRWREHGDGRGC
jgi:hypothetical protein